MSSPKTAWVTCQDPVLNKTSPLPSLYTASHFGSVCSREVRLSLVGKVGSIAAGNTSSLSHWRRPGLGKLTLLLPVLLIILNRRELLSAQCLLESPKNAENC